LTKSNASYIDEQTGEDTSWSYNVGASFTMGPINIGGAFRRGPLFHYDTQYFLGPAQSSASLEERLVDSHQGIRFKVPDSYAAGLAAFPTDDVKLTFEYTYVQYDQLIDGSGTGLPVETAGQVRSSDPEIQADGIRQIEAMQIDNAHQVRAGIEWSLLKRGLRADNSYTQTVFLRAGTWFDPDHRVRSNVTDANDERILMWAVLLPEGENETHFSFGGGLLIGGRVQIDAGVDLSPRVNTFAVSSVVYF
jgi:hypothetical protein